VTYLSFLMCCHVPRSAPPTHNILSFQWVGVLFDFQSAVIRLQTDPSTLLPSVPCACDQRRVIPVLYLCPLNDSFVPKHIVLLPRQHVRIGRQTNAKAVPGERNGYFGSKVLSRQYTKVWEHKKVIPDLLSLFPLLHEDDTLYRFTSNMLKVPMAHSSTARGLAVNRSNRSLKRSS
jgi:hypothetical protein